MKWHSDWFTYTSNQLSQHVLDQLLWSHSIFYSFIEHSWAYQRQTPCDCDERLKKIFSEDGHSVNERSLTLLLVVNEHGGWVVVSDSLGFIFVVVYPIEGNSWVPMPVPSELLILSSEFLASVTVPRVMVNDFIIWLISFCFILKSSERNRPTLPPSCTFECLTG